MTLDQIEARWGWLVEKGTESAEDAEAAQTIVKAFQNMQRALDERQQTIRELLRQQRMCSVYGCGRYGKHEHSDTVQAGLGYIYCEEHKR